MLKQFKGSNIYLVLASIFIFAACDAPIGLGSMINTEKPKISLPNESPTSAGSFLKGNDINTIELNVEQPFGMDIVYMLITYTDKAGIKQTDVIFPAKFNDNTGLWETDVDTSSMADGQISAKVIAKDKFGNETVSTEIIYFVKGDAPQIELTVPGISGAMFDTINFNVFTHDILTGNSIMGIASDFAGIKEGFPKIRIWPAETNTEAAARYPVYLNSDGSLDETKEQVWNQWHSVLDSEYNPVNTAGGAKAAQFRWPLAFFDEHGAIKRDGYNRPVDYFPAGGVYRFQIITRDILKDGSLNQYPNRNENKKYPSAQDNPYKYINVRVTSLNNPVIAWSKDFPFPAFYNADGSLEVHVNISGGQHPYNVKSVILNDNEPVNLSYAHEQELQAPGLLKILIPVNKIERMLGKNKNDPDFSGDKMLYIAVNDSDTPMRDTSATRPLVIDAAKPWLQLFEPAGINTDRGVNILTNKPNPRTPDKYQTSCVSIRGSALDNQMPDSLWYALGVTETNNPLLGETWDNNTGWTNSGLGEGNPRQYHRADHQIGCAWIYDNSMKSILSSWELRFRDIAEFVKLPHPANTNGNYYVELASGYTFDNNIWYLPVKFKLIDKAKNVSFMDVRLTIDPDADRPSVEITSHNNNTTVGGTVRINGTANDNEWIKSVEIKVTMQSEDDILKNRSLSSAGSGIVITAGEKNSTHDGYIPVDGTSGAGPNVSWFHTLNADGSMTYPDHAREVKIEVRAKDAYLSSPNTAKDAGTPSCITLYFDSGVPVITDIEIIRGKYSERNNGGIIIEKYVPGISRVSGFVTLRAKIQDNSDITSVRLKGAGNNQNRFGDNLISPFVSPSDYTAGLVSDGTIGNKKQYTLYVPFDTIGLYGNTPMNFNMEIEAEDNASPVPYRAHSVISFQIDNFYPFANFETNTGAIGDFHISGKAWDSARNMTSVEGVERIVIYFSNPNGVPVNLDGISMSIGNGFINTQEAVSGREATVPGSQFQSEIISSGGNPYKLPFFPDVRKTVNGKTVFESNSNGIVIDNKEERKTGYFTTQFSGTQTLRTWNVNFNSTKLAVGPYVLHYVVFDMADNATHYSQNINVVNNRPILANIRLGTDLNGDGLVDVAIGSQEAVTKSIHSPKNTDVFSDFRIRNNRFSLNVNTIGGNGSLNYRVSYVIRNSAPIQAKNMQKGQVYTIDNPGSVNWINYGVFDKTNDYSGITFTALKSGSDITDNNAKVYSYTYNSSFTPLDGSSLININSFANIPDSPKPALNAQNDRLFIVKVWDSAAQAETDALSHAAVIRVTIDNNDHSAPLIETAEFGKKYTLTGASAGIPSPVLDNYFHRIKTDISDSEYDENIVTSFNGTRKGYVQYASHDTGAVFNSEKRANISGMVIFKGKACDNGRIDRITAQIAGFIPPAGNTIINQSTNEFVIAKWNVSAAKLDTGRDGYTIEAMRADGSTNNWGFFAPDSEQTNTIEYAHALNWNFAWDSSAVTGIVKENVKIIFKAYDTAGNASGEETVIVNIVPYITDVITPLSEAYNSSPSAFNRSARGWYPAHENDTIIINGFNLGGTGASTRVALPGIFASDNLAKSVSSSQITANIGTASVSGELLVTVTPSAGNAVSSFNNRNNNSAEYNQEPNGLNNDILNDDRKIYVWNTDSLISKEVLHNPFFRMDSGANWYMSFGYGANSMRFMTNGSGNGTGTEFDRAYNKWCNTVVAHNDSGSLYGAATTITRVDDTLTGAGSFNFYSRVKSGNTLSNSSYGSNAANKRRLESNYNKFLNILNSDRVQFPKIAATGADKNTNIYMSYYDGNNKDNPVVFRFTTSNGPDSLSDFSNISPADFGNTGSSINRIEVAVRGSGVHRSGLYTAVGGISSGLFAGRAVIAWYDAHNRTLVYSYSSDTFPGAAGKETQRNALANDFQNNAKVVAGNFAGWHVDMAVDGDNGIHMAWYNYGNGGLWYVYLDDHTMSEKEIQKRVVRVDTYLSAGTKIMINTRAETESVNGIDKIVYIPYISYFHASFLSTANSVRIAWPVNSGCRVKHGTNPQDRFTGNWEVMTVPAADTPRDDFICNGVPSVDVPDSRGNLSGLMLARSMLVTYHTSTDYERAYIKLDSAQTGALRKLAVE